MHKKIVFLGMEYEISGPFLEPALPGSQTDTCRFCTMFCGSCFTNYKSLLYTVDVSSLSQGS